MFTTREVFTVLLLASSSKRALYYEAKYFSEIKTGLEIKIFAKEPNCIFISFIKVLYISQSSSLGSLQKFEGAEGEFKGGLDSWL